MDRPYLKALGSGFGVFGFGLNVVLRVAPMIGWQPSYATEVILLILGFVCMAGGALMVAVTVIPSDATIRVIVNRYRKPIVLWLVAVLAFAFVSWQSITIYRLASDAAQREAQEWPTLKPKTIKLLARALSKRGKHQVEIHSCSTRDCDNFADGFRSAFRQAEWSEIPTIPINELQIMWKSPPGIAIAVYGDSAGGVALHDAIKTSLGIAVPTLPYPKTSTSDAYVRFTIGSKPIDLQLSQ